MTTWAFNVGDGDTVLVEADSLSEAAEAVEVEWAGMINGCVQEGHAMYLKNWRPRNEGRDIITEARLWQADIKARTIGGQQ